MTGAITPKPNTVKPRLASLVALLLLGRSAQAGLVILPFSSGFANDGYIPDGNAAGWSDGRTVTGIAELRITDVSVKLNLTGGFNGDLYAYLSHDGVLVPLLNRVGVTATAPASDFGYPHAGFNVTLSMSAAEDVHFYDRHLPTFAGGQLTGAWRPDGRLISPLSPPAAFDSASAIFLDAFNDHDPNGRWTLFIADVSAGGGQSRVEGWELDITTVPESSQWAWGMGLLSVGWVWWRRRRSLPRRQPRLLHFGQQHHRLAARAGQRVNSRSEDQCALCPHPPGVEKALSFAPVWLSSAHDFDARTSQRQPRAVPRSGRSGRRGSDRT